MQRRNRVPRLLTAFALVVVTGGAALPAHARPARPAAAAPAGSPWAELWSFASRLWESGPAGGSGAVAAHGLRSTRGAEGASLDPHGGAASGAGTATGVGPGAGPAQGPGAN
jgi:hypothetical protein